MNIRNTQSGTGPLKTTTSENAELEIRSRSFFVFNTNCCIKAAVETDGAQLSSGQLLEKILDNVVGLCYRYEKLWSHTQKGSDIWRLNHAQGKAVPIDAETAKILQLSRHYCEETAGLFDVSIAPVAELWNFRKAQVPKPAEIAHALEIAKTGHPRIMEDHAQLPIAESKVTLGGIAKGYVADRVSEFLEDCSIHDALINLGGNIVVKGSAFLAETPQRYWRIGIRSPKHASRRKAAEERAAAIARSPHGTDLRALGNHTPPNEEPACILELSDCSIVTSSIYERCFTDEHGNIHHHIVDPRTGRPSNSDLASATVVSKRSIDGDGFSTALLIMGSYWAKNYAEGHPDLEAVLITRDGRIEATSGIAKQWAASQAALKATHSSRSAGYGQACGSSKFEHSAIPDVNLRRRVVPCCCPIDPSQRPPSAIPEFTSPSAAPMPFCP